MLRLKLCCIHVPIYCFVLANSADFREIPPYVAFHLDIHCLPKYLLFTGIQNKKGKHIQNTILKNTYPGHYSQVMVSLLCH